MFGRIVSAAIAVFCLTATAGAQVSLSLGVDSGDGNVGGHSNATVTTQSARTASFDGPFTPATVLSAVNVRNGPESKTTSVIGTLQPGGTVMVRCSYGWCELQDGGFVAQKFLSFESGSFDVVQPPAEGETTAGEPSLQPPAASDQSSAPAEAGASFAGDWTVVDDAGQPQRQLKLAQSGAAVTGTLAAPNRVARITGDVEGSRLSFTYQMVDGKGAPVANGNGELTLGPGGNTLSGVLMLNGLVIGNLNASR